MRAGLVVQWCQAFIIQATFFVLPLYLQTVLGFDSLKTGVTILPMSAGMFIFALGGSALTGRYSPKQIVQPRHRRDAASARSSCCTSWTRSSADGASASGSLCSAPVSGCWPPRSATSSCPRSIRNAEERPAAFKAPRSTSAPRSASRSWARSSLATLATNFTHEVQSSSTLPASVKQQISEVAQAKRQLRVHDPGRAGCPACRTAPAQTEELVSTYSDAQLSGPARRAGVPGPLRAALAGLGTPPSRLATRRRTRQIAP